MNRSQEREQAFIILFEKAFNPDIPEEELISMAEESEFIQATPFTKQLIRNSVENSRKIDEEIEKHSVGWSLSRMTRVSLAILRLSVGEILFAEDIPDSVSINEAVELAKKYAGKKDSSFINGVLGSVVRSKE